VEGILAQLLPRAQGGTSAKPLSRCAGSATLGLVRTQTVALVLTSAALISSAALWAQTPPRATRTMSVDELRPGMRGYGLTVFQGVRPERFNVEVVDVLHGFRPGMDMVLVRPTHAVLERTGTVAGMSGSPIYINDRLIGAYAYGWDFGRETVAGVTPIANMFADLRRPRRTPPGMLPGTQVPIPLVPPAPAGSGARPARRTTFDAAMSQIQLARGPVNTAHGALVPLSVPLSVAGMSDGAVRYLTASLEPFGVLPLQAGGTGRRPGTPPPAGTPDHFEPGGSISVDLIAGDISGASTGTVTWVQGPEVLAFGHPMMGLGEIAMPTSISRVAWINANLRRSHKMAEPVRPLGALEGDRPSTIIVNERGTAPTIPMRVRVAGPGVTGRTEWNVTLAYHRALISRLYAAVVGSVLETVVGDNTDAAWTIRSRVVSRDRGTLAFTDHGASSEGTGGLSMGSIGATEAVDRLTDNPFEQVMLTRIDVDVELRWARDFYYVRNVALSREEVDPGETVQLMVSLGQYNGRPVVRAVPIPIPRDVAGRDVEIEVAPGGETVPDLAEPESITDLIRNVTTSYPEDALVVSMRMPGQGVLLRGRTIGNLPSSALDVLRPSASTDGGEAFANVRRIVVPMGRLMLGRDRIRLRVREVRQ
jgi:hypothetical protein